MSDKKFCTDCGAVNPIEGIKCHNCYSKNFGEVGIKHAVLGEYDPFKFLREENEMLKTVHESQRKDNERLIDENARLREALESIASVGNEHLTNLDELLKIHQVELAAVIMNDTVLAREALGVK